MEHLLAALTRPNRLALELSMSTGLRISDCLSIRSENLGKVLYVKEAKTSRNRRIFVKKAILDELKEIAGENFVFEHRLDPKKHRTRQAVYKDLKRACKLFRLPKKLNITSHTARKIYAVKRWNGKRAPKYMTDILGHSSEPVAMLYTMADLITLRQHPELKNYILNSTMR